MVDIQKLYKEAEAHLKEHDCSAHPYKYADKLVELITTHNAEQILEIGTGMGFTAAVMALANPRARIDTIEKDPEHIQAARDFLNKNGVDEQVSVINLSAEKFLPEIQNKYDLIFFDGFQVHYEFLPQYYRLLRPGKILVVANNHLKSKTSDQFFAELADQSKWKILETFGDTTVVMRV